MGNAKVKYRYPIVVEWGEDNRFAFLPDIDGCVTTGATVEETVANMHEALQMHLEFYARRWGCHPSSILYRSN